MVGNKLKEVNLNFPEAVKSKILLLGVLGAILISGTTSFYAAVPQHIRHQGVITDTAGDPVADSTYSVTITIYDAESDGTVLWSSGLQSITTVNGFFSYLLGSNMPFPAGLFTGSAELWLTVQVGSDPEISPRTRLISAPYALHTGNADVVQSFTPEAVGATEIADSSITEQDVSHEDWIAPTLLNSWINYENGYNPAGYFKDINGVVHLRGIVRDGPLDVPIFQLPNGYRPENSKVFIVRMSPVWSPVIVSSNGDVVITDYQPEPWLSLDGITFRASGN